MTAGDAPDLLLEQGMARQLAGDADGAAAFYARVLEAEPGNAQAWHLLALVRQGAGDREAAREHVARALELDPEFAEALNTLGGLLLAEGDWLSAADAFRRAVLRIPDFAEALANLGDALRLLGDREGARKALEKAIRVNPGLAQAHNNLGVLDMEAGAFEAAERRFRKAAALDPGLAAAEINLAEALRRQGRPETASTRLEEAAGRLPPSGALAMARGNIQMDLADYAGAEARYGEARAAGKADDPHLLNNLGNLAARRNRLAEAVACYDRALALKPDFTDALANLGAVRQAQGRLDQAVRCFAQALELDPDHADAHWNRGIARLLTGDLEGGFADYEWRWRLPEFRPRARAGRAWAGEAVDGKTVLLRAEQGFGDTIQFVRLAWQLAEKGARVVLETHATLSRLMESAPGIERIVTGEEPALDFDFQLPLLGLAHRLGLTLETVPDAVPYLAPPPGAEFDFHPGMEDGLAVGIAWAGRPSHRNDANRSCDPARFAALAEHPGVRLFSLQMEGMWEGPWESTGPGTITDATPGVTDFADTAAIVGKLDLVITVDTALAHLAGALARPCWVVLPFAPDWRWLLERTDSPWYPTLRLFRQPTPGDWGSVFAEVGTALSELASRKA